MCECEGNDEYKEYPFPCLAWLMWGDKEPPICPVCNPLKKYMIPALCGLHLSQWVEDQKMFERKYYK